MIPHPQIFLYVRVRPIHRDIIFHFANVLFIITVHRTQVTKKKIHFFLF